MASSLLSLSCIIIIIIPSRVLRHIKRLLPAYLTAGSKADYHALACGIGHYNSSWVPSGVQSAAM